MIPGGVKARDQFVELAGIGSMKTFPILFVQVERIAIFSFMRGNVWVMSSDVTKSLSEGGWGAWYFMCMSGEICLCVAYGRWQS
ncbi:MAG: hypothetical protein ACLTT1_09760 [[Clostridium] scindens]